MLAPIRRGSEEEVDVSDPEVWPSLRFNLTEEQVDQDLEEIIRDYTAAGSQTPMVDALRDHHREMKYLVRRMDTDIGSLTAVIATLRQENETLQAREETDSATYQKHITKQTERATTYKRLNLELEEKLASSEAELLSALRENQRTRSRSTTPFHEGRNKKSVRLPDPPPLTDGRDPFLEDWINSVRKKFKANADHYDTEELRMAYVSNLVKLPAKDYLRVQENPDHPQAFQTAEEMLEVLKRSIGKSKEQRRNEARQEYRSLYQKDREFSGFWADFQRLSSELNKDKEDMLEDLRDRISPDLQRATLAETFEDVYAFAEKCSTLEPRLNTLRDNLNRQQKRSDQTKVSNTKNGNTRPRIAAKSIPTTTSTTSNSSAQPSNPNDRPPYVPDPNKQALKDAGLCFKCAKPGHQARDCQTPYKLAIKLVNVWFEEHETDENQEYNDHDHGNEQGN